MILYQTMKKKKQNKKNKKKGVFLKIKKIKIFYFYK